MLGFLIAIPIIFFTFLAIAIAFIAVAAICAAPFLLIIGLVLLLFF